MSCSSSSCAPSSSLLPKSLPDSSRSSVDSAQALEPVRTDDPPALKAETVHLPLRLPPPPLAQPDIDLKSLVVDPEHRDRPIGFVIGRIKSLGTQLMTQASTTRLEILPTSELPPFMTCRPPILSLESETFNPSHVLAIHAPDSKRVLLLPVHGLLWASQAAELSILSSSPQHQPPHPILPTMPSDADKETEAGQLSLPVVHLHVPSSLSFPLVQAWIYTSSPSKLLKALLPALPARIVSPSLAPLMNRSTLSIADDLSHQHSTPVLLKHISLVHSCWQDGAAIGLVDPAYWETLARAWTVLVAALASQEQRKRYPAPTKQAS